MRSEIDKLMEEAGLDALLVRGPSHHNPSMAYFTGYANLTSATLIKKRGADPVLIHFSVERDEAAKSGCRLRNIDDYDWTALIETVDGDMIRATSMLLKRALEESDIHGQVALYGRLELGQAFSSMKQLEALMPDVQLVGEPICDAVLTRARNTKDAQEVERIRRMGRITTEVVSEVADYLTSQRVKDDVLTDENGRPITIGDVRSLIELQLARRGADNPESTIFAMGHDAAVPHSIGADSDVLRVGLPIIFDIFPCEQGGGYFYDFTRTWCLGHAPEEVEQLYEDVLDVYNALLKSLRAGGACRDFQLMACDIFEARGHPTVRSDPKTEHGYVHSLGHGLGLDVHEAPRFSGLGTNDDVLEAGSVITLEPGLYYPERDMGVRLEDTLWIRSDGPPEVLAKYPLDLVLPIRGS